MSTPDPIWLAMVLGAYVRILPLSHHIICRGDHDPERAYQRLKQILRKNTSMDVDILDIGPGSAERRQILAEGLRQNDVSKSWRVRRWANMVLASVLKYTPQAITAAGFTEADVQSALDALAENSSVTTPSR